MTERATPGKSAEAYRTIGEVAEELKLPQHVLRFWETRFPQVKPLKRAGGRRFYRPEDVALLRAVKLLLYGEGYTIKGVQRLLQERGPRAVAAVLPAQLASAPAQAGLAAPPRAGTAWEEGGGDMRDDDRQGLGDRATPPHRVAAAAVPPAVAPPPAPHRPPAPTRAGPVADMAARLEAVAFDLSECERLLLAARALHD